jgi:hypothetical protein
MLILYQDIIMANITEEEKNSKLNHILKIYKSKL